MSEVQADLDGIRMLGDLLHRQSQHVAAAADFLDQYCQATGAFDGVLLLLRGTYAEALDNATEGLRISREANQMLADRCAETAENYEKADNDNYIAFARLAGAHQMTIGPYRRAGSGIDKVQPGDPYAPLSEDGGGNGLLNFVDGPLKAASGAMTEAIEPVTGVVGGAVKDYKDWTKPGVKALHGAVAEKTVLWQGQPFIESDLMKSPHYKPDSPGAFESWHEAKKDGLTAFAHEVDPTAKGREDFVKSAREDLGLGQHRVGNAETQHRINKGMEWSNNVLDTYGAVTDVAKDPTLGARGLLDDAGKMVDTYGDVVEYVDISNNKVDTSVRDELRESR